MAELRGKGRRWKEVIKTSASGAVRRVSRKVKRKKKVVQRVRRTEGELNVGRLIPFCKWTVYRRNTLVMEESVGKMVAIYNGHRWFNTSITEDMVGSRFGEFAPPKQWRGSMIHRGNKTEVKRNKKISNLKAKKGKGGGKQQGGKKGGGGKAGAKGGKKITSKGKG